MSETKLSREQIIALLGQLTDDDRKGIAAELMPAQPIRPGACEVVAYVSQNATDGNPTSLFLKAQHGKQSRNVYLGAGNLYAILARADELALSAADEMDKFAADRYPEGINSWKAEFEALAEAIAEPLEKFRKAREPQPKGKK